MAKLLSLLLLFASLALPAFAAPGDEAVEKASALLDEAYEQPTEEEAMKKAKEALGVLTEAESGLKDQASYYKLRGYAYDLLHEGDAAWEAYSKAKEIEPDNAEFPYQLGQIRFYQEKYEEAAEQFKAASELNPEHAHTLYMLGLSYSELEDRTRWPLAQEAFAAAMKLSPEHPDYRAEYIRLLNKMGKHEEAVALFEKEVAANPDDLDSRWNFAQACQSMGAYQKSLDWFSYIHEHWPEEWRALEKMIQLAESLKKKEKSEAWRKELEALYRSDNVPDLLKERGFFIREQFEVDEFKVYGIEYFDLVGDRAIQYSFSVYREPAGQEGEYLYKVTLGSYDYTTRLARELGEIGPDERRFHMDTYFDNGYHETLGFFNGNPGWEKARGIAIQRVKGEAHILSSSGAGPSGEEEEKDEQ